MVLIGIIMVFYFRKKMVLNRVVIIERIMPWNAVRKNRIPYEEYKKINLRIKKDSNATS
jgi:hypothetical protein